MPLIGPVTESLVTGPQGQQGPPGSAVDAENDESRIIPGPVGPAGTTGKQGPPGYTGEDGEDSFAVIPGQQGKQGIPGIPGANGNDGADGLDGPPGIPGVAGSAGATGATGTQGPPGYNGEDGEDGLTIPPFSIDPSFDFSKVLTAAIAATTNDWNPTEGTNTLNDVSVLRVQTDSTTHTLTGMVAPIRHGKLLILVNITAATRNFFIEFDDPGSIAANRFYTPNGQRYALRPFEAAWAWYDNLSSRWQLVATLERFFAVPTVSYGVPASGIADTTLRSDATLPLPPLRATPGVPGDDGEDGYSIPGVAGAAGAAGATGATGANGNTIVGMDGDQGEDGLTVPGMDGVTGATGATGATGLSGNSIVGMDGDQGEDGLTVPGLTGITGATGTTGATGATGVSVVGMEEQGEDSLFFPPGVPFLPISIDYIEFTASVNITHTTEGTADTIVTSSAVVYDGNTTIRVKFQCTYISLPVVSGAVVAIWLFQDGTSLGRIGRYENNSGVTTALQAPVQLSRRLKPASGSHTYSIRANVASGTGIAVAGLGGTGVEMPGFIEIERIVN